MTKSRRRVRSPSRRRSRRRASRTRTSRTRTSRNGSRRTSLCHRRFTRAFCGNRTYGSTAEGAFGRVYMFTPIVEKMFRGSNGGVEASVVPYTDCDADLFDYLFSDEITQRIHNERSSEHRVILYYVNGEPIKRDIEVTEPVESGGTRTGQRRIITFNDARFKTYRIRIRYDFCVKRSSCMREAIHEQNMYTTLHGHPRHQHLPNVYSQFCNGPTYHHIVMERYQGTMHLLNKAPNNTIEQDAANTIFSQLQDATSHLLNCGMVHCDIKRDNVLVKRHQPIHIVLSDLGLCFTRSEFKKHGNERVIEAIKRMYRGGTPRYKVPDPSADVEWTKTFDVDLFGNIAKHRNNHEIMVTLMRARTNGAKSRPMGFSSRMYHYDMENAIREWLPPPDPTPGNIESERWCQIALQNMLDAVGILQPSHVPQKTRKRNRS